MQMNICRFNLEFLATNNERRAPKLLHVGRRIRSSAAAGRRSRVEELASGLENIGWLTPAVTYADERRSASISWRAPEMDGERLLPTALPTGELGSWKRRPHERDP